MKNKQLKVAVIGLGYVGLPLAIAFGKLRETIGFDVNVRRVEELRSGNDVTKESSFEDLTSAKKLKCSFEKQDLRDCNCYIVCVPTPIDKHKQPDLTPLLSASKMVGAVLKHGDLVIYESTVYPGATEDDCVPVLEDISGLTFNRDFYCGYSPERINPGDKAHQLSSIVKVTSGSTPEVAKIVDDLYREIIGAGTFMTSSIRVAEASKVIENTQRDVNIAFMNELSLIFGKLGIDTDEVLRAASTKWNFLPFRPGLVGGHCIGVDPYYLAYKAKAVGHHPAIILAGRAVNDQMGAHIVSRLIKRMANLNINIGASRILILGLAFKENCSDIRNTRVGDVILELQDYGCTVDVFDPMVDREDAKRGYGIEIISEVDNEAYDAIIVAVAHDCFRELGEKAIKRFGRANSVLYDLKCIFEKHPASLRL
ncbi:nucleotide sugar dehydrogenase [Pseudomonadales bacterium]|nr:nucleotide sugar dehydrogenase [Pseudomonadales bacterium]